MFGFLKSGQSQTSPDIGAQDVAQQYAYYAYMGEGVTTFVDEDGELQVIPYTGTPPWGEPDMYADGFENIAPIDPPWPEQAQADMLHGAIHDKPYPDGYDIGEWVNPSNPGVPNLGPVNDQAPISARSAMVHHYPSDEQGWGMDPAVLLPRYPQSQNTNPFYAIWTHRRNGQYEFNSAGLPFGEYSALNVELQWQGRRRLGTHSRLVDNPAPVPYSDTVPVGGSAGPLGYLPDAYDEAVY